MGARRAAPSRLGRSRVQLFFFVGPGWLYMGGGPRITAVISGPPCGITAVIPRRSPSHGTASAGRADSRP